MINERQAYHCFARSHIRVSEYSVCFTYTPALAVIDVIAEENLVERANRIGALFGERLRGLQQHYPDIVGDIRASRGAMIALELVKTVMQINLTRI